jgi:exosortase
MNTLTDSATVAKPGHSDRPAAWWGSWALVVVPLAVLVFVLPYAAGYGDYRRTIFKMLLNSWGDPTWQHGALAIPLACFLAWRRREDLTALPVKPSVWGLVLAVLAMAMYWAGYRGNFYYFGYASIQLSVAAVVLWLWGWAHLRTVLFAWFIMGFAWPYLFLEDTLAFRLRYLMVTVTSGVLNLFSIDTLQDGTRLISAATAGRAEGEWFRLNVDGPCSGLRSLFALIMVSALFGYFRQRSLWRQTLLFALSIPLAILANMVRILVLIGATMLFGQEFALGRGEEYTSNFHYITGLAVFIPALGGLFAAEALLNRFFGKEKPKPFLED